MYTLGLCAPRAPRLLFHVGLACVVVSAVPCLPGGNLCGAADIEADAPPDDAADFDADGGAPVTTARAATGRRKRVASEEGAGLDGRAGHIGFKTFGRNDSITHAELFPYVVVDDDQILFADLRFFSTNQGFLGGNAGLGYRMRVPEWDQVFGASLWYDGDDTTQELFHQVGVSLETYGDIWELRSNLYFPVGDVQRERGIWISDLRFSGNDLLFDRFRSFTTAMHGADVEAGFRLPSDFAETHDLRVYAGAYHFEADDAEDVTGYKFRVAGQITDAITTQVEFTSDDTFGTNVALGVAYEFSTLDRPRTRSTSLRGFVHRNYNVIVTNQTETTAGLRAINPATGGAYVVQHVSSGAAAGGTGGVDSPHRTIAEGQAAGGDVVFVHSGSVLGEAVVLGSGTRVLGEGIDHGLRIPEFGDVLLPSATGGTTRPVIRGVAGDAVTLAAGAEFSGFVIDAPTGNGLVASAADGALVRSVEIVNAGRDGVFLQSATGTLLFDDLVVRGTADAGLHVAGGSANVAVAGRIENTGGFGLLVEDTTAGRVDVTRAPIVNDGGRGVRIANTAGRVAVGDTSVRNSANAGIDVERNSGLVTFAGRTFVDDSNGPALSIRNAAGTVALANVDATSSLQSALFVRNAANVRIDNGTLRGEGLAAAADVESSTVGVNLTSVSADGGPFGVRIVGSSGAFVVNGAGTPGSGGTIRFTNTGFLLDGAPTVAMQHVNLEGNGTAIRATNTNTLALTRGWVANSVGTALDLRNVANLEVTETTFAGNGGSAVRTYYDAVGTYGIAIRGNTITDASLAALDVRSLAGAAGSTLALTVDSNALTTNGTGSDAVHLEWNGLANTTVTNNVFVNSGAGSNGVSIASASTTAMSQIAIGGNTFTMGGTGDTGVRITTAGPSRISLTGNSTTFNAANGVGARFSLAQSADVTLTDNLVVDNVSSGTGFLFDSVDGPSNFTFEQNVVQLLSTDGLVDRGFVFTSVVDTVSLFGTRDNLVFGATTPFSAPAGTTTGGFFVNGVRVP